jgi:hypothetical protein
MAKGNRRLRSVVEGAMDASQTARRAAAAEKIRASAATPPAAAETPAPAKHARKPRQTAKPQEVTIEPDTKLEATPEQRVPPATPQYTAEQAQQLRDTMLQSNKPKRKPTAKPQPAKPAPPKTSSGGFAPIRGPGALLGRLLKETYRQAPNIAANVVAIPAFTAAGAGGAYLGTAATVAAIRGIGKLFATPEEQKRPAEPLSLPDPAGQPDDYRTGFQRAIDDRRKPRPNDSGFDVIRGLSRTRGIS